MARDYKELQNALDEVLRQGPRSMRELKTLFDDWPEWQVVNCTKYLGCVTVRGAHFFDPHTVYHPTDPDRPIPAVDTFLDGYFNEKDPRTATDTLDAAEAAGFTVAETKIAFTRLGIRAKRKGRVWMRTRLADDAEAPATPSATLSSSIVHNAASLVRGALFGTDEGRKLDEIRHNVIRETPALAEAYPTEADGLDVRLRAGLAWLIEHKYVVDHGGVYALTDEGLTGKIEA